MVTSFSPIDIASLKNFSNKERSHFFDDFFTALETGLLQSSTYDNGEWINDTWIRECILYYFQSHQACSIEGYPYSWDKIPLQHTRSSVRRVPGSIVRRGAHVGDDCILMPSFVNIGAFVGKSSMIDTWSTVGSCAHIGERCHISGGVGIGGVLEPLNTRSVIIEDDCFIGARCEIAEGVIVGAGSVLAPGVFLTQSTRIYDRQSGRITFGIVPPLSVVVPGTITVNKDYSIAGAIIVKYADSQTKSKTAINELLRMNPSDAA